MKFRGAVELGKFLGSVDIIPEAYQAISETESTYKLHTTRSGIDVLAFNCSPDDHTTRFLNGEFNLVSSENLQELDFIPTKVNSPFSINKAAVELFQTLSDDLKEEENKHIKKPLIVTGSGLGGYLAILSTLRLHRAIDAEESEGSTVTKRPICITFGSPLLGDAALQSAIAGRPQWKFRFLNVVAKKDCFASFFSSNTDELPFGTFLFCTESGGHTAFEDEESILPFLDTMNSSHAGYLQIYDYTNILSSLRRKILYRGASEVGEFNSNLLRAGIILQLREVEVLDDILDDHIEKMEKKQIDMIKSKKKEKADSYKHVKDLNERKISLIYMEWYMKSREKDGGYYDVYKAETQHENASMQDIVVHQRLLTQYWKKIVEDSDLMPQKEGEKLRIRWLYAGTNYRRIVEPLDIVRYYYIENKVNYIENRPDHYKLLEKWSDEDKKNSKSSEEKRNKAASLTEDSCFWAHVEEASISFRDLENGGSINIEKELEKFEAYVMCAIKNYSVSRDIFLEKSSLMKWWSKYKTYKGNAYVSEFTQYMNNKSYQSYE